MTLYDASTFEISNRTNPKAIYSTDHLYSRWKKDGRRDSSAELKLQQDHENRLPAFLDNLLDMIDSGSVHTISIEDRRFCIRISIRLVLRNPVFIEHFLVGWKIRLARILYRLRLKIDRKLRNALMRSNMSTDNAFDSEVRALTATYEIDKLVEAAEKSLKIKLLSPGEGVKSFILGNQPVLLQRKNWTFDENGDWVAENRIMNFYTVVDPRLMIALVSDGDRIGHQFLTEEEVNNINGLIIKYCDEVIAQEVRDLVGSNYQIFEGEDHIRQVKMR